MTDYANPSRPEQVEREMLLPAPPEEVWDVVTSDGWLADEVTLDLVPGGQAHFAWSGSERDGWVEEAFVPGSLREESGADGQGNGGRLVFWWAEGEEPSSRVELTLERDEEGRTRLRVRETRPVEALDLVGIRLPRTSRSEHRGPALLAAA